MEDPYRCGLRRQCPQMRPEVVPGLPAAGRPDRRRAGGGGPGLARRTRHDCGGDVAVVASGDIRAGRAGEAGPDRRGHPAVTVARHRALTGPGRGSPSSAEMPDPSDRLTRLQLLGDLARGGMGAIIKGRDTDST